MKILVVGSDKVYAIENFFVKYLKEFGADVYHFTDQTMHVDYYQKSIFNKIIFRAGLSTIYKQINDNLKLAVEKFTPGIIWVFKGMEIFPETLKWAKGRGIKLVNYNPDNPFIFSSKGSGNKNVTDSIGLYDLHFTYNLTVKKRLEEEFHAKAIFLPFGFDVSETLFSNCAAQEEVLKTCFLGNPDPGRVAFIQALATEGIAIDLYGNSWNRFISHPGIRIFEAVYGDELWKVLRRYRVQLNLMRIHNEDSHNMRSFEVPGIGGIMAAPDTKDHRLFFKDEEEIFLYNGVADCKGVIQNALSLSADKISLMRENARRRSIISKYTYRDRTKQALDAFHEVFQPAGSER